MSVQTSVQQTQPNSRVWECVKSTVTRSGATAWRSAWLKTARVGLGLGQRGSGGEQGRGALRGPGALKGLGLAAVRGRRAWGVPGPARRRFVGGGTEGRPGPGPRLRWRHRGGKEQAGSGEATGGDLRLLVGAEVRWVCGKPRCLSFRKLGGRFQTQKRGLVSSSWKWSVSCFT